MMRSIMPENEDGAGSRRQGGWLCAACLSLAMCLCGTSSGCGPQLEETGDLSPAPAQQPAPSDSAMPSGAADRQSAETAVQQVRQLEELLRQRLALMPDVARWKWAEDRPVSDPAREEELLSRLVSEGEQAGLSPDRVRPFFAAQFAASRTRQQELSDRWQQSGGPETTAETPDLINVLRPQITRLSSQILTTLAAIDRAAASQPEAVRNELLRLSRQQNEPADAAWQHVLDSLEFWADTLPRASR